MSTSNQRDDLQLSAPAQRSRNSGSGAANTVGEDKNRQKLIINLDHNQNQRYNISYYDDENHQIRQSSTNPAFPTGESQSQERGDPSSQLVPVSASGEEDSKKLESIQSLDENNYMNDPNFQSNSDNFANSDSKQSRQLKTQAAAESSENDDSRYIMVGGYISSKEFEEIAEIYDQLRQWNQDCQNQPIEDSSLASQFDQELKIVMKNISMISQDKLGDKNSTEEINRSQKCIDGLEQLYSLCQVSLLQILEQNDSAELSIILRNIFHGVSMLSHKYRQLLEKSVQQTSKVAKQKSALEENSTFVEQKESEAQQAQLALQQLKREHQNLRSQHQTSVEKMRESEKAKDQIIFELQEQLGLKTQMIQQLQSKPPPDFGLNEGSFSQPEQYSQEMPSVTSGSGSTTIQYDDSKHRSVQEPQKQSKKKLQVPQSRLKTGRKSQQNNRSKSPNLSNLQGATSGAFTARAPAARTNIRGGKMVEIEQEYPSARQNSQGRGGIQKPMIIQRQGANNRLQKTQNQDQSNELPGPALSARAPAQAAPATEQGVILSQFSSSLMKRKSLIEIAASVGARPAQMSKNLTLRQLQDLIFDMYQQKSKYDMKCMQNKLARETMEEYMYTYLNQRYGLRSLTISWASTIINGIRQFSKADFDVHQFGKILRGQISEFHRFNAFSLKEQVVTVFHQVLAEKYHPLNKTEEWLQNLEKRVLNGAAPLEAWMSKKILQKLEGQTRSGDKMNVIQADEVERMLASKLQELGVKKSEKSDKGSLMKFNKDLYSNADSNGSVKTPPLQYAVFIQVLLTYHLKQHERYIGIFHAKFQQLDVDNNSSLKTKQEFEQLLLNIHLQNQDGLYQQLVNKIDPFGLGKFSFSETVQVLLSEMIHIEIQNQDTGQIEDQDVSIIEHLNMIEAQN